MHQVGDDPSDDAVFHVKHFYNDHRPQSILGNLAPKSLLHLPGLTQPAEALDFPLQLVQPQGAGKDFGEHSCFILLLACVVSSVPQRE